MSFPALPLGDDVTDSGRDQCGSSWFVRDPGIAMKCITIALQHVLLHEIECCVYLRAVKSVRAIDIEDSTSKITRITG